MAMNKGEWSEFYTILSLLINPKIKLVSDNLELLNDELYTIKKLSIQEKETIIDYVLKENADVSVLFNKELNTVISSDTLIKAQKDILKSILTATSGGGAFEIKDTQKLLNKMTKRGKLKSKSLNKDDLQALVLDNRIGFDRVLKYSIKSSLGRPATILNSSRHTNFIYEVSGLNKSEISIINKINTKKKLIDRIKKIKEFGGKISFVKTESENFNYNLKLIDSNMPNYLANILLNSYENDNKNLKELFFSCNNFIDHTFALKKLGDLLEAISFGFFPSKKWNGINNVDGGLIIVKKDGQVVILDLIYFRQYVRQYLINQTVLDSPDSKRYHMLKIEEINGKFYFKLNLQIRYKN